MGGISNGHHMVGTLKHKRANAPQAIHPPLTQRSERIFITFPRNQHIITIERHERGHLLEEIL